MGVTVSKKLPPPADVPLWRRLAAILYDCFAVFAVCFVAGGVVVALRRGAALETATWWFTGYLVCTTYAYFGYCWRRGQTLGMRSWKIRIVDSATGGLPSWSQTAARFVVALLGWVPAGLGVLWAVFDRDGRAWHDRVSATHLIRV